MQLVKIEHNRCGEYDGTEYILAPDEWKQDRIAETIRSVVKELIHDAKLVKESPLNPGFHPVFVGNPDKTVREIQTDFENRRQKYQNWVEENKHLTRSFEERLREKGFVSLWEKSADVLKISTYWDHNHGLDLNYVHSTF